ncbi:MAG: DNA starvation/stationary phase protection protein [Proteobacteria bacterium]|nr:DNA starvation/stationary phase protection protein [Pseudomonadota bacterium]NBP16637.1 DNA starvation/stationary phase protection protein [bacterium]
MEQLHKLSKIAFASTFSFYLKAHQFHWNVEGEDFLQYHDLFGKIYEEVYGSIDTFAEQIRAMGSYMPGSYTRFNMLTQIEDEDQILPKDAMLKELLLDNEKMITILKKLFEMSEAAGEHGFSNFVADRMDAHRKHGWMLRASMKR